MNNEKTSPTLRKTCNGTWLDRPCPIHGEGIRKEFNLARAGEMCKRADKVVETTAKQWEIV